MRGLGVSAVIALLSSNFVFAQVPAMPDLNAQLADASRYVREKKAAEARADLNTNSITEEIGMSRFYKKGDRWTVAVSHISHGMVHKHDQEEAKHDRFLEPVLYEFQVTDVNATTGEAKIEVTESNGVGQGIMGSRASRVVATVNNKLKLVSKEYFYPELGQSVVAEMGSDSNVLMGFDSFPIELPDLARAKPLPHGTLTMKDAPKTLSKYAGKHVVDPAKSLGLTSSDLFSRQVRVIWQKGDLWPAYVETKSGRSVLVKQEKI